jgi:uridine phosphorylase
LVLEKLVALGAEEVIVTGWCGSLQPHVAIGDVVLPESAVSEEGTSRHYPPMRDRQFPDPGLLDELHRRLAGRPVVTHRGEVWTTDAPYRETVGKVRDYQSRQVLAVEMEAAALFAVAAFRNVQLAAAMAVSDELASLQWNRGFKDPRFLRTRETLAEAALDALTG